jgi:diaminohydroxyphosphoribosylaminopyrimidine deaminase / 5-amino-6-(5-phosphoribosylamino)uracil reductase
LTLTMPADSSHVFFMRQALRLAAKGCGFTSPNPMVGAVVVRQGEVIGRGYHQRVGGPHAEINALRDAGDQARGATLYVTLEPCNHQGRTPPCTQAILDAGIAQVVIGMSDPNPQVAGGGVQHLRTLGVEVTAGVIETECRRLNQAFIKHVTTGLPLVTIKAATTLDGRIATRTGDARWISNERSRRYVHRLRCDLDAILVGIGTALSDDPLLTARVTGKHCRQPVRIVLDSHLQLPLTSQLVQTVAQSPVWVASREDASPRRRQALTDAGVNVLSLPAGTSGIDLTALLRELGRRGFSSVLVEGGARVLGAFMERDLSDEFHFFYAPKILGDPQGVPLVSGSPRQRMTEAVPVYDLRVKRFGEDVLLSGRFRKELY